METAVNLVTDDPHSLGHTLFDISHFILAVLYILLMGLSLYFLISLPRKRDGSRSQPQTVFFQFLMMGSLIRIAWCLITPLLRMQVVKIPWNLVFLLNTLPSFLFFTGFLVILFLWAEMYHNLSNKFELTMSYLRWYFVISNALMYFTLITLWILDASLPAPWGARWQIVTDPDNFSSPHMENGIIILIEVVFFGGLCGFCIYGILIYRKLARLHHVIRSRAVPNRIAAITGLNAVCFALRAAIVVWADIAARDKYNSAPMWWVDISYFVVLEIVPLCLLMFLLRAKEQRRNSSDIASNDEEEPISVNPPPRNIFAPTFAVPQSEVHTVVSDDA